MAKTEDATGTELTSAAVELVIRRIPKKARAMIVEPEKSRELEAINKQAKSAAPADEERCAPAEEAPKASEKTVVIEQVHASQTENTKLTPTQEGTVETRAVSPSSSGCQYGYGYLSQRKKGEGIPDACIECPKSLSCMLPEYYKKEEIVKEISA